MKKFFRCVWEGFFFFWPFIYLLLFIHSGLSIALLGINARGEPYPYLEAAPYFGVVTGGLVWLFYKVGFDLLNEGYGYEP